MDERTDAGDTDVLCGYLEVPEEVAGSKALDHAACWRVAPESSPPVHGVSFFILEDYP